MADPTIVLAVFVLFLAALVRSTLGFGEALVAVPLLALIVPVEIAAPLAMLVSLTVALIAVVQDWRKVHFRSAGWLVISTMAGIPFGLWLIKTIPEPVAKCVLAVLLIGFALFSLKDGGKQELHNDNWAWPFGFVAGVLGGAYGLNGPPLAAYGALRRWPPEHFRATLQGYFLPASLMSLTGYWVSGLWKPAIGQIYLYSLPLLLVAALLGRSLNRRIQPSQFLRYVHIGLLFVGALLFFQAFRKLGAD